MDSSADLCRRDGETVWRATGHERPVFLDESGRRRRWVMAGGVFVSGASAFWFTALIAGAVGFSTLPSMRPGVPSGAVHSERHEVAAVRDEVAAVRHRHGIVVSYRRSSSLARATGLAVSRGLVLGE